MFEVLACPYKSGVSQVDSMAIGRAIEMGSSDGVELKGFGNENR